MELLKLLLSDRAFKAAGVFLALCMLFSLRYWYEYYAVFAIDMFQFTTGGDLLRLSISRIPYTATVLIGAAVPLLAVLILVWSHSDRHPVAPSTIGIGLVIAVLSLFLVPSFAVTRAARNDAAFTKGRARSLVFHTLSFAPSVRVYGKDGKSYDDYRWIGAMSDYLLLFASDSTRVVLKRADAGMLQFGNK